MKGFEWLQEIPDLNVLITNEHIQRFPPSAMYFESDVTLLETIAVFAVMMDDSKLLRFVLDNGILSAALVRQLIDESKRSCEIMFIDAGFAFNPEYNYGTSMCFVESRNLARSSAILVMHAMRQRRKTYKNVSVIIGRAIWASRWDAENWLEK